MSTQRYSITFQTIQALLAHVHSGDIAIPEIQRPFVWDTTQVRDLLDSLYQGYPVGYLISWRNPRVKLKDGTRSTGKRILIDGQQRITSLMAALLGQELLTKDYKTMRVRIAFHPIAERFEVHNSAIARDKAWIDDITKIFSADADLIELTESYTKLNEGADRKVVGKALLNVSKIMYNHVGLIELADDLDIDTVTLIFIRVNSAGTNLSQADFAMSKIAVNESFGGNLLRKAIDYFCHLSVAPEYLSKIVAGDPSFAQSKFLPKMQWLKNSHDKLYHPTYTDMLRVAFTSEFRRGRLRDLVALLSGRNFETREYKDAIAEDSFAKLEKGVDAFINETNFGRLVMILRSSGFLSPALIRSQNAVNFAYIFYLHGRDIGMPADNIECLVRRWYAMSILTRRYSANHETTFEFDIRRIETRGPSVHTNTVIESELTDAFWIGALPESMSTSSTQSPYFIAYQAAQAKLGDRGFLSKNITVKDLLLDRGDKHHIFPQKHLQSQGLQRGSYNQIANLVLTQNEINIAISDKNPQTYFAEIQDQVTGGPQLYGGITDQGQLLENFDQNCIPASLLLNDKFPTYNDFLEERRLLMALKIKKWFESLS